jgi:MoxR-like ATPase
VSTFNDQAGFEELAATAARIREAMERVIEGKPEVVKLALTVLLAEGHLLVEDVPGVGKTMLAKSLARAVDCTVRRVQFTPDLLPSDITGVSVYDQERREFEFKPGAIFANIVVGDEINRASPKTQSALLECMAEHQVTVDGKTYELRAPFMVIATQNPVEMEGTYPLPEAQRDRFMARVSMGYPAPDAELRMIGVHGAGSPLDTLESAADAQDIVKLSAAVREVHVSPGVARYAVDLVNATRTSPELRLGASPRATLHLIRAARAAAALDNRGYVLPDDIQALAVPVLAHRLLPTAEAQMSRRTVEQVVADIVRSVPVPGAPDGRRPAQGGPYPQAPRPGAHSAPPSAPPAVHAPAQPYPGAGPAVQPAHPQHGYQQSGQQPGYPAAQPTGHPQPYGGYHGSPNGAGHGPAR